MLLLKCGGSLYGQEYSHAHDEFIFKNKQTGKQTRYRKQLLAVTPPQYYFVAESNSQVLSFHLALQLINQPC
ncbi:hypothetical protein ACT4V6_11470 [Acinetobacter baumannii]